MHKYSVLALVFITMCVLWACDETPVDTLTQEEREDQIIQDYLSDLGITDFEKTESGMYYRYLEQNSSGGNFEDSLIIAMGYTGKLFYGDIFDSSILRDDTLHVESGTGLIYGGMEMTPVTPPVDTTGGRTADTVMCATFTGGVISGWREAMGIIKLNERMEFYMPSQLAYGGSSSGIIPPNTPIMFEMVTYSIDSLSDMDERCR